MQRRNFLQSMGIAAAMQTISHPVLSSSDNEGRLKRGHTLHNSQVRMKRLHELTSPIAIAMWDYSWLQRHHRAGEFEDWDRVLDELVERGYDAIRIDVFPHLVASNINGEIQEEFTFLQNDWKPVLWGNQYTTAIRPREGLLEFLPKCKERNILVGMATWFIGPTTNSIAGLDNFIRVWDETLTFLDQNGFLDNCLYVDLLNEYPLYHGFKWLNNQLNLLQSSSAKVLEKYDIQDFTLQGKIVRSYAYNDIQKQFYRSFMTNSIDTLSSRWPDLDFFTSQSLNYGVPWEDMDFSRYSALDVHVWFGMNGLLTSNTGYLSHIAPFADNDQQFSSVQHNLNIAWTTNQKRLVDWMSTEISKVAHHGKQCGIPYGSTEGWGLINWMDHPGLDWEIIKRSGEICAKLGYNNGYLFNCTSNFSHPQFPGLWKQIEWHRYVTDMIRGESANVDNSIYTYTR